LRKVITICRSRQILACLHIHVRPVRSLQYILVACQNTLNTSFNYRRAHALWITSDIHAYATDTVGGYKAISSYVPKLR
jgi:hypothetical protein